MEDEFQISNWAIIFFADATFFFLTTFYINNVIRNESLKAGIVASMQNFSSYLALYFFVRNFEYILPACAGAFLGTYLATEYDRRNQNNQQDELAELRKELEELREEIEKLKEEKKESIVTKKVVRLS